MKFTKADNTYVVKLERGDEVMKSLTDFAQTEGINNATLTGIGAVDRVSCGYYELPTKQYHFTQYDEMVEVVSMKVMPSAPPSLSA